jgi:hypothetical protein
MTSYDCQPITLWMIATLVPVIALFFAYMSGVHWWSRRRYPRLIDDMNRRRLFEGVMVVGGLFAFILAWGFLYEWLCRV